MKAMMAKTVQIGPGNRLVGSGNPVFIIAEAGVNHNGDPELAHKLVDGAATAGADAIKFQTFDTKRLVTPTAPKADYQATNTGTTQSQYDMLAALQLDEATHHALKAHCDEKGIMFLSSPFDEGSVDFLVRLGVPALKIPSGELTNLPYLHHAAGMGLPLIVSTGMATLGEVEQAVGVIRSTHNDNFLLLHCVSDYPADPAEANLRAMETMAQTFEVPIGFSDHTPGIAVSLGAVALGACVIEKHFTLERDLPGPDHKASLDLDELSALIIGVRTVEAALGDGVKRPQASELSTAAVARKSLVAARDIPAGTVLESDMVEIKRPGTGLPPTALAKILGRRTRRALAHNVLLSLDDLDPTTDGNVP